ncbi:MAG: hypothetical protein ACOYJW_00330 [Candidatus Omnitrophota bacterium]|jgi:preprotein translocase subunit SecF
MSKIARVGLLSLCVVGFAAFNWGSSSTSGDSMDSKTNEPVAITDVESSTAKAAVAASRILGSGTPEEKQARLESLRRLSESMAKYKQLQSTPVETSVSESPSYGYSDEYSNEYSNSSAQKTVVPVSSPKKRGWF